ncbi:MAG: hypothetical protein AB1938_03285 [Myxococcota bacterium]
MSGPVGGPFSRCTSFDQLYRANLDTLLLSAGYNELTSGLTYELAAELEVAGTPSPGQAQTKNCQVTVTSQGTTWLARTGLGAVSGACSVSFSEVVPYPQAGNTISYCILKGTIRARLLEDPLRAASEPVDVQLNFDLAPAEMDPDKLAKLCEVKPP